jgi:Fur family transcriptional regulator, peroxide stress response regulator
MDSERRPITPFEAACRKAGLKVTHQRLEIYRELAMATDHPTAESLHRRLRKKLPTISLDTVYRTLATLAGHGLINRVETPESLSRFEVARTPHHHLICRDCGEIVDFSWSIMDKATLPEEVGAWGKIDHKSIVVYGVCAKCLNPRERSSRSPKKELTRV